MIHSKEMTEFGKYTNCGHIAFFLSDKEIAEEAPNCIPKLDLTYSKLDTESWCKAVLTGISSKVPSEEIENHITQTYNVVLHCKSRVLNKNQYHRTVRVSFNNVEDYAKCSGGLNIGCEPTFVCRDVFNQRISKK